MLIANSYGGSAFDGDPARGAKQVGFTRVVTDRATVACVT
jgi:hypothetical protein